MEEFVVVDKQDQLSQKILRVVAAEYLSSSNPRSLDLVVKSANALAESVELQGIAGISFSEVARLAGLSRGSIYRLFPTAWDLAALAARVVRHQTDPDTVLTRTQRIILLAGEAHLSQLYSPVELGTAEQVMSACSSVDMTNKNGKMDGKVRND